MVVYCPDDVMTPFGVTLLYFNGDNSTVVGRSPPVCCAVDSLNVLGGLGRSLFSVTAAGYNVTCHNVDTDTHD